MARRRSKSRIKNNISYRNSIISNFHKKQRLEMIAINSLRKDYKKINKRRKWQRGLDQRLKNFIILKNINDKAYFKKKKINKDLSRYKYAKYIRDICKKRKERREILFTVGGAGKGKRVNPVRIYNETSNVRC